MSQQLTNEETFELDESLYCLEAIQNAAYAFTDRAYVRVEAAGPGKIRVGLRSKPETGGEGAEVLRGEFENELLHQALRVRVSVSNQKIREFIVTKALVSAQPTALVAAAAPTAAPCPECPAPGTGSAPPAVPAIDEALEKEIDRLLIEIEKGGGDPDPLGVNVPWEEKFSLKKKRKPKKVRPQEKP